MPQLIGKPVGPIGYGMMGLTTSNPPVEQQRAFQAMHAALEAGCNFFNAGEHYGTPDNNSQTLLAAYLKENPDDAEKIVLSVKGAFDFHAMKPDGTPEGLDKSLSNILKALQGTKKVDIFECARVDPNTPLHITLGHLQKEYVEKGIIGGISLSEVNAATIREAAKTTKIVAVEVELSLWSTQVLDNGVAKTCAELDIPIIAYSPIGKGMLGGQIKSLEDIPADDYRRHYPRFSPQNFPSNIRLVEQVKELAAKRNCTPAQFALNWTKSLSSRPGMPIIIPIPGSTSDIRVRENAVSFDLSEDEMSAIDAILDKFTVSGARYPDGIPSMD